MAALELSRKLRLILESSPDAPSLSHLLQEVTVFVSSHDADSLALLEDELQQICIDIIDHSIYYSQIKIFLAVLYHLLPILPSSSIISTWFDLVLRPALREPKLPAEAVNHAKELILSALNPVPAVEDEKDQMDKERDKGHDRIRDFRRRLMDLYLLDAYNDSSGNDVLEWAESDDAQKERTACWKANLEDVLVRLGLLRPQDLLTEIHHCFATPQHRLQLLVLLSAYTSQPEVAAHGAVFASHPVVQSLIYALILDNSSTECTVGITVLTKLLPMFAVKACEDLKRLLPSLYVILARIVCWETRQPYTLPDLAANAVRRDTTDELVEPVVEDKRDEFVSDNSNRLPIRLELDWNRLEQTFSGATSAAPPRQQYFSYLYYLFPCNTIRFLRGPVSYLNQSPLESPYILGWDQALDADKIRSRSESLLRGHTLHPLLIWRDAGEELAQPDFWVDYDIYKIVSECTMLDVRAASVGLREQLLADTSTLSTGVKYQRPGPIPEPVPEIPPLSSSAESSTSVLGQLQSEYHGRLKISLQEMITTSIALKSGLDVEVIDAPTSSAWTTTLAEHSTRARSPSRRSMASSSIRSPSPAAASHDLPDGGMPANVALAIAGLQREVLMLRCELNFELWMARENVKHIGRLYQDRILSRTAEVERQGLHNRLREYKSEVYRLQKDLKEQKEQALSVKNQYADWNKKLQDKIRDFRNEKAAWLSEAAALRAADKEAKDTFAAQKKLLSDATRDVFELQTREKATKHKVDRLHDYEKQIDQLIALQRLWEIDVQKLNDQTEYLRAVTSKYKKMEQRVASHEAAEAQLEELSESQHSRIQSLEAQLSIMEKRLAAARKAVPRNELSSYRTELGRLTEVNAALRDDNSELREEMEELRAMLELLKGQVSGRQSMVADPRASPFLGPALQL